MKSILIAVALFLSCCYAFSSSSAQATNRVRVEIPFAFTAGDTALPAGTYIISAQPSSPIVRFESPDGVRHFSVTAHPEIGSHDAGRVVFHQYGEQLFLSRVSAPGLSANLSFAPAKAEKRAKTRVEEAGTPLADPVIVALY